MPTLEEAIGVSAEAFSDQEASFEFIYVDHSTPMSDKEKKAWREAADELEILRPQTQMTARRGTAHEFPIAFDFRRQPSGPFMSRAERRRMERELRKAEKKRSRKRP